MRLVVAVQLFFLLLSDAVMTSRTKFWEWNFRKPTPDDAKSDDREVEDVPQFHPTEFHDFVSSDLGLGHTRSYNSGYYPRPSESRLPANVYQYGPRRGDFTGRQASGGANPEPEVRLPFLDSYEFFAEGNSVSAEKSSEDARTSQRTNKSKRSTGHLEKSSRVNNHHRYSRSLRNSSDRSRNHQSLKGIHQKTSLKGDGHLERNIIQDGHPRRQAVEEDQHRRHISEYSEAKKNDIEDDRSPVEDGQGHHTVQYSKARKNRVGGDQNQMHTIESNIARQNAGEYSKAQQNAVEDDQNELHTVEHSKAQNNTVADDQHQRRPKATIRKTHPYKNFLKDSYSQRLPREKVHHKNHQDTIQKWLANDHGAVLNPLRRIRRSFDMGDTRWPWLAEDTTPSTQNDFSTFLHDIPHQISDHRIDSHLWKDHPVPAFVATFLPLSLIVAAAMPLLVGNMRTTNGIPLVTTTATGGGGDGSTKFLLSPLLNEVGGFTPRGGESDCIQKAFCRTIADPVLSSAMEQVAAFAEDKWLEAFNLKTLMEVLKSGDCEEIVCDENFIATFSNTR